MKVSKVKNHILTLSIALAGMLLSSCLAGRFVWYNFSDITDHRIFPSRPLPKSKQPFYFASGQQTKRIGKLNLTAIDSVARTNHSVAFLIIRNDSLLFENYYQGYTETSVIASFSAAKSYISALIGAAIADGYITSVEDPITQYIPELQGKKGFETVTIQHLLQMTSGIRANENYYNPFGQAARLYYGRNLRSYIRHLKMEYAPGTRFAYRSVNTQLLGFIVERATGKSVTTYMQDRIWGRIGTEFDASWSIDKKNGMEKTFCCINARALDFAKFGRLYLNHGNWNGEQILPASWIEQSTHSSRAVGGVGYYQYQWWLTRNGYEANGLHGEYIYVCPAKKVIIVRLGTSEGKVSWENIFDQIAASL